MSLYKTIYYNSLDGSLKCKKTQAVVKCQDYPIVPIEKRRKARSKSLQKNSIKSGRRASCPKAIQMAERITVNVKKQRSCGAKCKNRKENLSKESILKSFEILNRDCEENNSTCDDCGAKMLSDLGRISKGKPSRDPGSLLNVLRIEQLSLKH